MAQELLSIDEALELVLARVVPLPVQDVPLGEAYDRFLARDLNASIDLPPFANSAMDGFALRASDTPGRLRLVGESAAGAPYTGELAPGEAIVISTGAVVPAQADAVVQLEVAQRDDHAVTVSDTVEVGNFVRYAGSDIRAGEPMLAAGTRIAPAQIGAAAAVGLGTLPCRRRPQVAVLTTGTELRPPGEELGDGEIFDANGPMLEAALRTSGAEQHRIPAAADTVEAHREALEQALEHDVVISSGGVSVGAHDLVRGVGRELGVEEVFWRVAMRPGKPIAFGVRGVTLVFGLPGNPVSTLVGYELFVRPALLALQGAREPRPPLRSAVLATAASRQRERDDLIRVRLTPEGLEPLPGQQSHQIAIAAQADGLALIPRGEGRLPAGTEVAYLPLH
jgi:molybdopterin molybdotransferase